MISLEEKNLAKRCHCQLENLIFLVKNQLGFTGNGSWEIYKLKQVINDAIKENFEDLDHFGKQKSKNPFQSYL